ncbi:MAG: hypothetical protein PVI44_00005, partial [Balneolaceae bacterium]
MDTIRDYFSPAISVGIFLITLLFYLPRSGRAQQNIHPFSIDLNLGGGLIGNTDRDAALQTELGLNYMPGVFGIGLKAGIMSYKPAFEAAQYTSGIESYTSVKGAGNKWSSFFIGIGPRFDFGGWLPLHFRSSLDVGLSYNAPPEITVSYYDPNFQTGAAPLELSAYAPGTNYHKWSMALRPALEVQFTPGGSDRFTVNITTGVQHRFSDNSFNYTQKDLSKVIIVNDSGEMYTQLASAPDVQRQASPPITNFFATVGISFKFGKSKHLHSSGVIHRDLAARNTRRADNGSGDCEDGEPCPQSDTKAAAATDYNSSRSNTTSSIMGDSGDE